MGSKWTPRRGFQRRGQFFPFHYEIFESEAYRSLNCNARCLLFELRRHYFPGQNEEVYLSVRVAASRLNVNKDTVTKAFQALADRGFIVLTNHALWQQRISRKWRLTWEPYRGREPTDDWRGYKNPGAKSGDKLSPSKVQNALQEAAKVDD